nr:hypothetical protein CFP56_25998 [Quercus suber]
MVTLLPDTSCPKCSVSQAHAVEQTILFYPLAHVVFLYAVLYLLVPASQGKRLIPPFGQQHKRDSPRLDISVSRSNLFNLDSHHKMDGGEDDDELKLAKVSAGLLVDLETSMPTLLWKPSNGGPGHGAVHSRIRRRDLEHVVRLVRLTGCDEDPCSWGYRLNRSRANLSYWMPGSNSSCPNW